MSMVVLLISILFAALQTGGCYLLLEYEPIAAAVAGIPQWLLLGGIFALGMLLSFLLILLVGATGITKKAADFVRDNFGRVLGLMLASVLIVLALGCGAEAAYHIGRLNVEKEAPASEYVCYVMDNSSSMRSSDMAEMTGAVCQAVEELPDGVYVSVLYYNSDASIVLDWTMVDAVTRVQIVSTVQSHQDTTGLTDYIAAFELAEDMVQKVPATGNRVSVIMLSDGAPNEFVSVQTHAPLLIREKIPVHTIGIGNASQRYLRDIAEETGGTFRLVSQQQTDSTTSGAILDATQSSVSGGSGWNVPDTLLTVRDARRQTIIPPTVLRILLLFIVSFVFKLIVSICMGNNKQSFGSHLLSAALVALAGSLAVEFGYMFGLPLLAVLGVYWLLLMGQLVSTQR